MGLEPMFGPGAIAEQVQLFQKRLEDATLFVLQYLGEELVKYAKDKHNYTDRTGNLTNSIAYAVVREKDIAYWGGPETPNDAEKAALATALKMVKSTPNTFSLIIVAGMNYAAYVEAKGYNVLLPAELKAKTDFPKAMQGLMDKAQQKAKELFGMAI